MEGKMLVSRKSTLLAAIDAQDDPEMFDLFEREFQRAFKENPQHFFAFEKEELCSGKISLALDQGSGLVLAACRGVVDGSNVLHVSQCSTHPNARGRGLMGLVIANLRCSVYMDYRDKDSECSVVSACLENRVIGGKPNAAAHACYTKAGFTTTEIVWHSVGDHLRERHLREFSDVNGRIQIAHMTADEVSFLNGISLLAKFADQDEGV